MNTYRVTKLCVPLLIVAMAAATTQAAMVYVDFDGPGYVAGQLPPAPWHNEYDREYHYVGADVGYGGTQGLVVPRETEWAGLIYELPTPLTSEMGAMSISVYFQPQSMEAGFSTFGGMSIGYGSRRFGTGVRRSLTFERESTGQWSWDQTQHNRIYEGGIFGTQIGTFTPGLWHEIVFAIHADWQSMTISAGPVGGEAVSTTTTWNGNNITRIWLERCSEPSNFAVYDNFAVIPEPASLALLAFGGLMLMRRRAN